MKYGSHAMPKILNEVDVRILPNRMCEKSYGTNMKSEKMICAGRVGGKQDACQVC